MSVEEYHHLKIHNLSMKKKLMGYLKKVNGVKMPSKPKHLQIRGTQINYYFICHTKLWFFSHHIQMEQESDLVSLGKVLHKTSYKREHRDFALDDIINVDFIRKGDTLEIHEVKKSTKMEKAHIFQLLYYLYYLKHEKGISNARGFIDYPKIRKKEEFELNPENEAQLEEVFEKITEIITHDLPKPVKKQFCRKCAYFELCWV